MHEHGSASRPHPTTPGDPAPARRPAAPHDPAQAGGTAEDR
ncbi:hypothetical protein [Streptomyces sp. NPDC098781]